MNLIRIFTGLSLVFVSIITLLIISLAMPRIGADTQIQGVTFSQPHATGIGLDWREAYQAILGDLQVKHLRLNAYWDQIEPSDNQFAFRDLDYQLDQAAEHNARVILSVGRKLPRWPECHIPAWARQLSEEQQREQVLAMLEVVVNRYKGHPALRMWQLENEPFLDFGVCDSKATDFLVEEESLIRSLDARHPILITDSGELNSWLDAAKHGDIVGTTMYRTVFSARTEKPFSYDYIFPSWLYRLKSRYVKLLRGKDVLISELQGEPWGAKSFPEMTPDERRESFSEERFVEIHDFAQRTQLPEAYWWGVEYWYMEKEQGNSRFWDYAKTIFSS